MKLLLIIILLLIAAIVLLSFIIKAKNKQIKSRNLQIDDLLVRGKDQETRIGNLMREIKIEKSHNKTLAKKFADIACMSIDDVMRELQND